MSVMKRYSDISIEESVDSFCAVFGNDLVFENNLQTHLLLPAFNIGFYENSINPDSITKAVDYSYFLFENISSYEAYFNEYDGLFPNKDGHISFKSNNSVYKYVFNTEQGIEFELEGLCFRYNSYSYANFKIRARSLNIIIVNDLYALSEYDYNETFKIDTKIQDFLLNKGISQSFIEEIMD